MSEDGAERRRRLKAMKEKANKSIKFRNYRPQDPAIRQQALDSKGNANSGANKGGAVVEASTKLTKGMPMPCSMRLYVSDARWSRNEA